MNVDARLRVARAASGIGLLALGAVAAFAPHAASASEGLALEGTYLRNTTCNGDVNEKNPAFVSISADQIRHVGGTCTIDERNQDGTNVTMRVTCKFQSGSVLSSSISFARRDDATLDMTQQDGSFKAVLHRCPR